MVIDRLYEVKTSVIPETVYQECSIQVYTLKFNRLSLLMTLCNGEFYFQNFIMKVAITFTLIFLLREKDPAIM